MSYGIQVEPDPQRKMGTWFLHTCFHEDQIFQYNPEPSTWYSFDTIQEAQTWFNQWYRQRKSQGRWMPPIDRFTIIEIPGSSIITTITKDEIFNSNIETPDDFRTVD